VYSSASPTWLIIIYSLEISYCSHYLQLSLFKKIIGLDRDIPAVIIQVTVFPLNSSVLHSSFSLPYS